MPLRPVTLPLGLVILSACGGATEEFNPFRSSGSTSSGFETPNVVGTFNSDLSSRSSNSLDGLSGTVGFQVGIRNGTEFRAISGLTSDTVVTALPAGNATYTGTYKLLAIEGIGPGPTGPSAETVSYQGRLDTTLNITNGTLVGTAVAPGESMILTGQVSGSDLTGTVEFNGVRGVLNGKIGGDQALAAFHGNASDTAYAGGYFGVR